jgi:hypothetical protein
LSAASAANGPFAVSSASGAPKGGFADDLDDDIPF